MSIVLRLALGVASLCFFAYVLLKVANKKLLLEYSLLWLVLAIVLLVCAIWPEPVYLLSRLVGIAAPSNFVFALAFLFVLAIALFQSAAISKQSRKITALTQEIALMDKKLEESERLPDGVSGGADK